MCACDHGVRTLKHVVVLNVVDVYVFGQERLPVLTAEQREGYDILVCIQVN